MNGKIIAQSRPSGSTVKNNDSVTITIGRYVQPAEEPETPTDEEDNGETDNSGTTPQGE